jgi:ABC-type uncharacterized transport system substrate-binding protein
LSRATGCRQYIGMLLSLRLEDWRPTASTKTDLFRRSAGYVDRILRGEKAADLPFQLPTKYRLTVNLKTANALGIKVPAELLVSADEVIE